MTAHTRPIPSPADPFAAPSDQVGHLPVGNSPVLNVVLLNGAPSGCIFAHKLNDAAVALMDAKIGHEKRWSARR